ncbi:hypothetical protein [Micromonospora sp. NPDC003776]
MVAVPPVGASNVISILISVVLPAPFGPSSPKTTPCGTTRSTRSTTTAAPNRRVSPRTTTASFPLWTVGELCTS